MKYLSKKLRSNNGASMLLAMVFMMFCVFVGGTVLAAATANGNRVAQMAKDQQTYLSQRSAALLLADQLKGNENDQLQMTVVEKTTETVVKETGEDDVKSKQTTVSFALHKVEYTDDEGIKKIVPKTGLQKLLYDGAVMRYMKGKNLEHIVPEQHNFDFADGYSYVYVSPEQSVNLSIKDPVKTDSVLAAEFTMEDDYDLSVLFGTDGQLKLLMNAYEGTSEPVIVQNSSVETIEGSGDEKKTKTTTTTTTTTTTVIRWDDPIIEKGGAMDE